MLADFKKRVRVAQVQEPAQELVTLG